MRILICGLNYAPELTGVGRYTGEMGAWLAHRGHEVRVITAVPYYPRWRPYAGYRAWRFGREVVDGVRVLRCPLWIPKQPTGVSRVAHLLSFAVTSLAPLLWTAWLWRPDVVWTVEPTFLGLPGALLAARLARAKACLHVQDIELSAAFQLKILPRSRLFRLIERAHDRLLRSFDFVSTISKEMAAQLGQGKMPRPAPAVCPNWVDTGQIRPLAGASALRSSLGLSPGQLVVLYAGNMGRKQGLEALIAVARRLRGDARIVFVLAGDGAIRARVSAMAAGLPNVVLLPLQPEARRNELLNLADIHVLPQLTLAGRYALPSKLGGMLASGRPVIAMSDGESGLADQVAACGIAVPVGDVAAMADAILRLAGDAALRQRLGHAARAVACTRLDRDMILRAYESALGSVADNLVNGSGATSARRVCADAAPDPIERRSFGLRWFRTQLPMARARGRGCPGPPRSAVTAAPDPTGPSR